MVFLALILALAQPVRLSSSEQAARGALRRAVARLENREISLRQFERLAPRADAPAWRRLQRRIVYPHPGALDLAFALAYYGIDYPRNLQRLLVPYRHWRSGHETQGEAATGTLEALPDDLRLLYLKHHDAASLAALLDLRLDGAPAEAEDDVVNHLWVNHAAAMLRLSAHSSARQVNLASMLAMLADVEGRGGRIDALRNMQPFTHHADQRVALAAKRVITLLQREYFRPRQR